MNGLSGIGLTFDEVMSGWVGVGHQDTLRGLIAGRNDNTPFSFNVHVEIKDLGDFMGIDDREASIKGTMNFPPLGTDLPIDNGTLNIFSIGSESGDRMLRYSFNFVAGGDTYFVEGDKIIRDDPGLDVVRDMTTLHLKVHKGSDGNAPVYGAGQLFFNLTDLPGMLASMQVTNTNSLYKKIQARIAFASFAWGNIRQVYLNDFNPLYDTEYENLVLSGTMEFEGETKPFFFVSGVHDKDFPWGDGELFWDVLLVIGDEQSGYRRFCASDRILEGLSISVSDGEYRYQGEIFEILDGYSASHIHMREGRPYLKPYEADFRIEFEAREHPTTPLPVVIAEETFRRMATAMKWMLKSVLPSENIMGIYITPHTVTVRSGTLALSANGNRTECTINTQSTFGEAERSTFRNIKEPTMLYGYICAVQPDRRENRVQIHANSLRNDRQRLLKDQIDAAVGAIVARAVSLDMVMDENSITFDNLLDPKQSEGTPKFVKIGDPVLEVNSDHYPTAIFQRRIIKVKHPTSDYSLALEEDMDLLRREAENSHEKALVASIRDTDTVKALERVLEVTRFIQTVDDACGNSGKSKQDFSIVIKPNFMFAYNKRDKTTYTDPKLVHRLVEVLKDAGYSNIIVAEAQSTYGEYFTNRRVREVGHYLGYKPDESLGYKLVDLTEDDSEEMYLGPHLGNHPVPLTWKNADFRISFAKNKTHCYAYYTLTMKNIYGALPLADKFSEYHTGRDIYHTGIEYIASFPIHFGLVDAGLSADGPFGIFADSFPNETHTVIGGDNIVAVDWVGATKMGLDPKISKYMELAVARFGKPELEIVGDVNPYKPWLNVPVALSLFAHFGLDANDYFGNLFYMTGAYMDTQEFKHKSKDKFMIAARKALEPIQLLVFLTANGERTQANRIFGRFLTWLGNQ